MKRIVSIMSTKVKVGFALLLALSIVASYAASCWPLLLAGIIDGLSSGVVADISDVAEPLLEFSILCALAKLLSITLRVGADVSAASFEADMQSEGFLSALCLPPSSDALDRHSAELGSIIAQGVEGCSQLYKLLVKDAIPVVLTACFIGYQVAASASLTMLGIAIAYILLSFGVSTLQIRSQNGIRDGIILRRARLNGDVAQSLSHHEAIRAMAAERFEVGRLGGQIKGVAEIESVHHKAMGRYDACKQLLEVALFAGAAVVGVFLLGEGAMTAGAIVSTLLLFQQLIVPIDCIYRLFDEIFTSKNKVSRLMNIVGQADDYLTTDAALEHAACSPEANAGVVLEARSVGVLTPRGMPINGGIEFAAKPGDVLRIDGQTGCGKSSLVRAVLSYNRHVGALNLLGKEVSAYSRKQLADAVYYLPQESFIFSGTVRENVSYGLAPGTYTDANLVDALQRAMFTSDEVGDLLGFLDRLLPENGKDLSGGQRQRLQAARLFLRHPRLLLADEPTASLDIPTAKALMGNIIEHVQVDGGTVVYVSHQEPVQAMATMTAHVGKREMRGAPHGEDSIEFRAAA